MRIRKSRTGNGKMSELKIATIVIVIVAIYVLSSGMAFVSVYIWPSFAPTRLFSIIFGPLDWLSRSSPAFGRMYNGYHGYCYKLFVK